MGTPEEGRAAVADLDELALRARPTLELFLAGDVMTGRGVDQILPYPSEPRIFEDYLKDARDYVELAEQKNGPIERPVGVDWIWGAAMRELRRAMVRIVNLETSVTANDVPWPEKGINYRMNPRNVGCLTTAGLDVCILANNHVLDWDRAGLIETMTTLRAFGIKTAGAGRNAIEAAAPAIVDVGGERRVLAIGLAEPMSGVPAAWAAKPDAPGVALLWKLGDVEADAVAAVAERERRPGDVVVVSMHWGSNWGYEVAPDHVHFAHALVDRGVDVVFGHSSHHARPIEIYEGKPILYGCGDLINDYEGIRSYESYRNDLVLTYTLSVDAAGAIDVRMAPFQLRKMRLERASAEDARWLATSLAECSRPFGTEIRLGEDGYLTARSGAS